MRTTAASAIPAAAPATLSRVAKTEKLIAWGLLLLTLLLYWQTAGFQFINLDDTIFVTENPHVRAGLTPSSIQWALTTSYINWQPLVYSPAWPSSLNLAFRVLFQKR